MNQPMKVVGDIGTYASSKAVKSAVAEYNVAVDKMFESIHTNQGTKDPTKKYNPNDYERIAFKTRKEYESFKEYAKQNGVTAVGADIKIDGKFLVEFQKEKVVEKGFAEGFERFQPTDKRAETSHYDEAMPKKSSNEAKAFETTFGDGQTFFKDKTAQTQQREAKSDTTPLNPNIHTASMPVSKQNNQTGNSTEQTTNPNAQTNTAFEAGKAPETNTTTEIPSNQQTAEHDKDRAVSAFLEGYKEWEYAQGNEILEYEGYEGLRNKAQSPFNGEEYREEINKDGSVRGAAEYTLKSDLLSSASSFFLRQTEDFGGAIQAVQGTIQKVGGIVGEHEAINANNDKYVFNKPTSSFLGKQDNVYGNTGKKERAYSNNAYVAEKNGTYVVMQNGELVTDERLAQKLIKEHKATEKARTDKAGEVVRRYTQKINNGEKLTKMEQSEFDRASEIQQGIFEGDHASSLYAATSKARTYDGRSVNNAAVTIDRLNAANVAYANIERMENNSKIDDVNEWNNNVVKQKDLQEIHTPTAYRTTSEKFADNIKENINGIRASAGRSDKAKVSGVEKKAFKGNLGKPHKVTGLITSKQAKIDFSMNSLHGTTAEIAEKMKQDFLADFALMDDIKASTGIDLHGKRVTQSNLLAVNEAIIKKAQDAGVNIFKNGKIDEKALLLNAEKLGISAGVASFVAAHSNGVLGQMPQFTLGKLSLGVGKKLIQLTDDEGFRDVQKAVNTGRYVKQIATSVNKFGEAQRLKIEAKKAARAAKRAANPHKKPPTPTKQANAIKKQQRAAQKADNLKKKYMKKEARKVKQLERFNKSALGRANAAINRVLDKFAATKLGRLAKAIQGLQNAAAAAVKTYVAPVVAAIAGGFIILEGGILILFLVISSVLSFFELDYTHYAAYKLYEANLDNEKEWVSEITDYENLFKVKDGVGWGVDNVDFKSYITAYVNKDKDENGEETDAEKVFYEGTEDANIFDLVSGAATKVYINPFWQVEGLVTNENNNKDFLTELDDFNGKENLEISANNNLLGEKDNPIEDDYTYVTTENGHISNIKDIIAMTDVMYQFDINGSPDSVMGMTTLEIGWVDFKNQLTRLKNWASNPWWENIAAIVSGEFTETWYKGSEDGTVSWKAIKAYADMLFWSSHTNYYETDVVYYEKATTEELLKFAKDDVKEEIEEQIANGETPRTLTLDDLMLTERQLASMGICANPTLKELYIIYDQDEDRVRAYLEKEGEEGEESEIYYLDDDTFDVTIEMDDLTFPDDACLWDGMDSNEETLKEIKRHTAGMGAGIIAEEEANGIDKNPDDKERHYCWNYNEDERETNHDSTYCVTDTIYVPANNGVLDYNKMREDAANMITSILYSFPEPSSEGADYSLSADHNLFSVTEIKKKNSIEASDIQIINVSADVFGTTCYGYEITYRCYYTDKVTGEYIRGHKDENGNLEPECKGHEFSYCGGHMDIQSHGNVYSISNEHMALVDAYSDEALSPKALDWKPDEMGYNKIRGRVDDWNKPDKTTLTTMDNSGGSINISKHPQGSLMASCNHYNFYVNGENWKSGMMLFGELADYGLAEQNAAIFRNMYRDIFDIDMVIDKGCDVLPLGGEDRWSKYECWNADNITIAALKVQMDWYGLYEFDAPFEMNQKLVSEEDITLIVNDLKEQGYCTTDEQENLAKIALGWVGKGHYSKYHEDHNFLSTLCTSDKWNNAHEGGESNYRDSLSPEERNATNPNGDAAPAESNMGSIEDNGGIDVNGTLGVGAFDACCTAGTSKSFVNFILTTAATEGEEINNVDVESGSWSTLSSVSSLKTGDVVKHEAFDSIEDIEIPDEIYDSVDEDDKENTGGVVVNYVNSMLTDQYSIYIGKTSSDFTLKDGTELGGKNLFVDLTYSNYAAYENGQGDPDAEADANRASIGVVRLRFESDEEDDESRYVISNTEYHWWIDEPDENTKYASFCN